MSQRDQQAYQARAGAERRAAPFVLLVVGITAAVLAYLVTSALIHLASALAWVG